MPSIGYDFDIFPYISINLVYISIIIIIKYVRRALVLQANNLKASESDQNTSFTPLKTKTKKQIKQIEE